jgi:ribosomal protein S6--L-glutamate ligase
MDAGRQVVKAFCDRTGINLAGFDLIFPSGSDRPKPLFLEINYFFGRRGLGGSERYYRLIDRAIRRWLSSLDLDAGSPGMDGSSEWEKETRSG